MKKNSMCLSECEPLILDLIRLVDQFEGGQPTVMTLNVDHVNADFTLPNVGDVSLPSVENGDYDFVVDWGDGTPVQRNIFEHNFEEYRVPPRATRWSRKKHQVTITGKFHGLSFQGKEGRTCLLSIVWGSEAKLAPAQGRHFQECKMLEAFIGIPDLVGVTDMSGMFYGCVEFDGDLSKWDTSKVQNMSQMFGFCSSFNGDLSNWNTHNVTNMSRMFYGYVEFDGDL